MTPTELQKKCFDICHAYTVAKNPTGIIDVPLLMKRLNEELGELVEVVMLQVQYNTIRNGENRKMVAMELADLLNTAFFLASLLKQDVEEIMLAKLETLKDRTEKIRRGLPYK